MSAYSRMLYLRSPIYIYQCLRVFCLFMARLRTSLVACVQDPAWNQYHNSDCAVAIAGYIFDIPLPNTFTLVLLPYPQKVYDLNSIHARQQLPGNLHTDLSRFRGP